MATSCGSVVRELTTCTEGLKRLQIQLVPGTAPALFMPCLLCRFQRCESVTLPLLDDLLRQGQLNKSEMHRALNIIEDMKYILPTTTQNSRSYPHSLSFPILVPIPIALCTGSLLYTLILCNVKFTSVLGIQTHNLLVIIESLRS